MTEIPFWIHEDRTRDLALIRGRVDRQYLPTTARWSMAGKGYVVPLEAVADMVAAVEADGVPYRVKVVDQ